MQLPRHLRPILLAVAACLALTMPSIGWSGADSGTDAVEGDSGMDAVLFCRPGDPDTFHRLHLSRCYPHVGLLAVPNEPFVPDAGPHDSAFKRNLPSSQSSLMEIQGVGLVRRKSGGSRVKYGAGILKSTLDGKVLGFGFSYQLAPTVSFSGQTGLGSTSISPQAVVGFGIRIKF
jgi:hypothetical protein